MAEFDRDGFLAAAAAPAFDRDSFLKSTDESVKHQANGLLAEYDAGSADLTPEEHAHLVDVAYKGTTPATTLGNVAKGIANASAQGVLDKAYSGIKTAGKAISGLFPSDADVTDPDEQFYTKRDGAVLAGVASAPMDILNVGQSLGTGAADLIDQGLPGSEQRRLDRITRSGALSHDINSSIAGIHKTLGANQEDPLSETSRFVAQSFVPVGGVFKSGSVLAKGADLLVDSRLGKATTGLATKAVTEPLRTIASAAPIVGGTALAAAGHVAEGAALAGAPVTAKAIIKKIASKFATDTSPRATDEIPSLFQAIKETPGTTQAYTYIKEQVDKQIADLQTAEEKFRARHANDILDVDDPAVPSKLLKGPDKQIRELMDDIKTLQGRSKKLAFQSNVNKVLAYTGKLGLTTAGEVGVGGTTMAGIVASQAQPEDVQKASEQGFNTGVALTGPFAPIAAKGGMRQLRAERGAAAWSELGKGILPPEHPDFAINQTGLASIPQDQRQQVNVMNGVAKMVNSPGIIVLPDEVFDARYKPKPPQKPEVIPAAEPAESEVPAKKMGDNGVIANDGTIYLRASRAGTGVAGHEIMHAYQMNVGKAAVDLLPNLAQRMKDTGTGQAYKDFENYYNSIVSDTSKTNAPNEVYAEVGRRVMQRTPPELFYGGTQGNDIVASWIRSLMPESWQNKQIIDPVLKAPVSRADEEAVRQQLFKLGEQAKNPPAQAPGAPPARPNVAPESSATTTAPINKNAPSLTIDSQNPPNLSAATIPSDVAAVLKKKGFSDEQIAQINPESLRTSATQLSQATIPQNEAPLQKATVTPQTETVPQEPVQTTPERGVEGVVPQSDEVPSHPDYEAIRTSAEAAKREELSNTNRKTKEQEISRAGLDAMAQEHAKTVGPDSDLVTFRTNKFGRESISGKRIDPNDPFHQHLLEQANLSQADIGKLNSLEANMGKTVAVDYLHAPEESGASGVTRKGEQAESTAPERVAGEKATRRLSKSYVPTNITYNAPSKTFEVNGFSPDKFLNNAQQLIPWAQAKGLKGYDSINDPNLVSDFNAMVENHKNGYTINGKPIEGTPLTNIKPNPDFTPNVIPKDRADLLNAMMGNEGAKEGVRKASPEKADKQILAQQNSPFWEPSTGETNKVRSMLGDESKLLESTSETLRPELIDNLRTEPIKDEQTLRPSGFAGDRAAFAEKGTPRQDFAAAGFMPKTENIEARARQNYEERNRTLIASGSLDSWDKLPERWKAEERRDAIRQLKQSQNRDVIDEMKQEGALEGADSDTPIKTIAYFGIGHEAPGSKVWIYDESSRSIKAKEGGTHGSNFGHDIADRSFKGWYDPERNVISVAFPEKARRELVGREPAPEDIPTDVYNKLQSKFGKKSAFAAFMPSTEIPKQFAQTVKDNNLDFIGNKSGLLWFNDPQTRSTIAVKAESTPAELHAKLQESRAENTAQFMPNAEKNLVAIHNLSEENLKHAERMGGLALPSIAITRADKAPFGNFGEISLVGSPEMITPSADMKVKNADAYSVRYPTVKHFLDSKSQSSLRDLIGNAIDKVPGADKSFSRWSAGSEIEDRGVVEGLKNDAAMQLAYLVDSGEKVPKMTGDQSHDFYEVRKLFYDSEKASEYQSWLEQKAGELNANEKIFQGFTNAGNRRYLKHDLDTVVRIMKKEFKEGEGFNYGAGSVRSKTATQFKTLKQIQDSRDNIVPGETMDKLKEEANNELTSLADEIMPLRENDVTGFGRYDAFSSDLKDMAEGGAKNWQYLREQYSNGNDEAFPKMRDFLEKLRNMPSEYFEAKPKRAVALHEFTGAIVPEGTNQKTIDMLKKRGLDVETYKKGDLESRRQAVEKMATQNNVMFQPAVKAQGLQNAKIPRVVNPLVIPPQQKKREGLEAATIR